MKKLSAYAVVERHKALCSVTLLLCRVINC